MFIVLTDEGGLDAADQRLYRTLVNRLQDEPKRVAEVQDYLGKPQARKVLTSDDGKATYIVLCRKLTALLTHLWVSSGPGGSVGDRQG